MGKYFGTDGIRGKANHPPVDPETALVFGKAITRLYRKKHDMVRILIGKDTRISCQMLEQAIAAGILSEGGYTLHTGVIPTPAVACLVQETKASAGVMISASHNPYTDNGIKVFQGNGAKLHDEEELLLEEEMDAIQKTGSAAPQVGYGEFCENPVKIYMDYLLHSLPQENRDLSGFKIVLDCANGATFQAAPRIFEQLKADVTTLFHHPDGKNINENCGSQHTRTLAETVVETGAHLGFAFDGDGDRLICIDEKGNVVTGDMMLAFLAMWMKQKGILSNNLVVSTVMSNLGLRLALKEMGIRHEITEVGDRYVLSAMQKTGAGIGGEDSGHMIFLDYHTTGDGILSALMVIRAMMDENRPLSQLAKIMKVYPQKLVNVEVSSRPPLDTLPEIQEAIEKAKKALGDKGRVLVRYSGTRPLCRVMVEAPSIEETQMHCNNIVQEVKNTLGTGES